MRVARVHVIALVVDAVVGSHAWSHCSCHNCRFRRSVSVAIFLYLEVLLFTHHQFPGGLDHGLYQMRHLRISEAWVQSESASHIPLHI